MGYCLPCVWWVGRFGFPDVMKFVSNSLKVLADYFNLSRIVVMTIIFELTIAPACEDIYKSNRGGKITLVLRSHWGVRPFFALVMIDIFDADVKSASRSD